MITRTIFIQDWEATFLVSIDGYDHNAEHQALADCKPPDAILERVAESLDDNHPNSGFTFSNTRRRESIIYVSPTTSGGEFISTFFHELTHLVCDICLTDGISLRGEEIAYLAGDIAHQLSDILCRLSCDHCRNK